VIKDSRRGETESPAGRERNVGKGGRLRDRRSSFGPKGEGAEDPQGGLTNMLVAGYLRRGEFFRSKRFKSEKAGVNYNTLRGEGPENPRSPILRSELPIVLQRTSSVKSGKGHAVNPRGDRRKG